MSDARLKDLKGYLEFLDEILKEGDSQELKISEDIQKADYMNLADDLGRAFALRDKAPMDFEYAGTKYSIRMGGDYVCGSGLGSLKNYYDICKDAIRSIVAKQECGEIERRDPEEVLADHVASMLLDTAFESSVPAVRDLCAVISSAETNRSAHNLMAAAASAANFRFLRNGKETFFDYMERTNAFWKKGGAELSRQADGSEIRLLSDIKCHGTDLEALYRRLLNVRRAKMKIVAV